MPSRPTSQCTVYDEETGRRCRRNGTGAPVMCRRHLDEVLSSTSGSDPMNAFKEVASSVLRGERPSTRSVEDAISGLGSLFGFKVKAADVQAAADRLRDQAERVAGARGGSSSSRSSPGSSSSGARPGSSPDDDRARAVSKARKTLGFTVRDELTPEIIKKRYRELAKKHHPDRGGSAARMAEINQAVEILTATG